MEKWTDEQRQLRALELLKLWSKGPDAEFIAAARELVPQLLNRVTSLGGALDEAVSTANWQAEQMDKLDAELRQYVRDVERQNEALSVLTRENDDLRLQARDAQIRNAVLQKRLDKLMQTLANLACVQDVGGEMLCTKRLTKKWLCSECWSDWLEQEVRA